MVDPAAVITLYSGIGFTIISVTHTIYCRYFHHGTKKFGVPFIQSLNVKLPYYFGFFSSVIIGLFSISMIVNYFTIVRPRLLTGSSFIETLSSSLLIFVILFPIFQTLGGPSATKGILEFFVFFLTAVLINVADTGNITLIGRIAGIGSILGLVSVYVGWLSIYIFDDNLQELKLRDAELDVNISFSFDINGYNDTQYLLSTVVFFVLSSAYTIIGFWVASYLLVL